MRSDLDMLEDIEVVGEKHQPSAKGKQCLQVFCFNVYMAFDNKKFKVHVRCCQAEKDLLFPLPG